jgi:hypothetical protein
LHGTFYLVGDGKADDPIRAHAFYYWHPQKAKIRGVAAAADGSVYDGEWTFQGDRWAHDFQLISAGGSATDYQETWVFPDNDTYHWTLYQKGGNGLTEVYKATFRRVKERPKA